MNYEHENHIIVIERNLMLDSRSEIVKKLEVERDILINTKLTIVS